MKKNIIFKIISIPFFALFAYFAYSLLEVLLDPSAIFVGRDLLEAMLIMLVLAIGGAAFFLAGTKRESRPKAFWWIMLVVSVLYGAALLVALYGNGTMNRKYANMKQYSLVPFKTIKSYIQAYRQHTMNTGSIIENLFGNLILFCPAGYIIPFFFKKTRKPLWFCPVMLGILCAIELIQFITGRGYMDIDDVILNFAGAVIFYILTWNKIVRRLMLKLGLYKEPLN